MQNSHRTPQKTRAVGADGPGTVVVSPRARALPRQSFRPNINNTGPGLGRRGGRAPGIAVAVAVAVASCGHQTRRQRAWTAAGRRNPCRASESVLNGELLWRLCAGTQSLLLFFISTTTTAAAMVRNLLYVLHDEHTHASTHIGQLPPPPPEHDGVFVYPSVDAVAAAVAVAFRS